MIKIKIFYDSKVVTGEFIPDKDTEEYHKEEVIKEIVENGRIG